MVWRGLTIAQRASTDYGLFLAAGLTLLLGVPVSLMMAGLLGLVPLTGVVTPFLSYGGSAMLANFAAVGALSSIRSDTQPRGDFASLRRHLGWAGGFMATVSLVLLVALVRVQIVRADEIVARPHLGMQADGSRRYQYNPRVLDVARQIPRGRVLDRRGAPLAVETVAAARSARADYQRLGISLDVSCPDGEARCYPIGGRMFHLIGDARSRLNWGASNTAFVERDAEARLRGFDDHQTMIRTIDREGAAAMFECALEVSPEHEPAATRLVELLGSSHDPTRLIRALSQVASAATERDRVAALWIQVADLQAEKKRDVAAALAALHRALGILPGHVAILTKLSELYVRDGQWAQAVDRLN